MSSITPAGYTHTIASKAYAAAPTSDLERAFDEWEQRCRHKLVRDAYPIAYNVLQNMRPRVTDLHAFMLEHASVKKAGHFLSAGYNLSEERIIYHDLDLSISNVGVALHQDKLLINTGKVGSFLGWRATGTIINLGSAGAHAGVKNLGAFVNAGIIGGDSGFPDRYGIAVSTTNPQKVAFHGKNGWLHRENALSEGLSEYVERLAETCRGTPEDILSRYGSDPSVQIMDDLELLAGVPQ